jgi:hypothetical protein
MNLFAPHFGSFEMGVRCVEVMYGREGDSTILEEPKNRKPTRKATLKIRTLRQSQTMMIDPTFS